MDFRFTNHGSVTILTPLTEAAQAWLDENVGDDETQYWAGGVVIEPRYAEPILEGLQADGLTVST